MVLNRLTESLARVCRDHPLAEKWLIAPSERIGLHWLQAVARSGQPVVNVRVATLERLAAELAEPALEQEGVERLDHLGAVVFIDRTLRRIRKEDLAYLKNLEPTSGLLQAILNSINDLRLAGVDLETIRDDHFEVRAKGDDLRLLHREYLRLLRHHRLVDSSDVLRLATRCVRDGSTLISHGMRLLIPSDISPRGLERQLLDSFPQECRIELKVDEPYTQGQTSAPAVNKLERLRWLLAPAEAPELDEDLTDKSASILQAVGEINEVREVLRRCLADPDVSLDQVELVHTDKATYLPAIYETFRAQGFHGTEPGEDWPVTFAEGIPCRYSRPGRALVGWVAWIRAGYPQAAFTDLIREGLVIIPKDDEKPHDLTRLADRFRSIKVGFGRDRYVDKFRQSLNQRLRAEPDARTREASEETEPLSPLDEMIQRDLQNLFDLVEPVIEISPLPDASALGIVSAAQKFLEEWALCDGKLDLEAKAELLKKVRALKSWLETDGDPVSLNAWDWLASLPQETPVFGSGPRPGCLHVDHVQSGGHSGRTHTFILGLDDARYPGAGGQDPLLLDSERPLLSKNLATSSARLAERQLGFARLLARLRGRVTLSFTCRDLIDDRELFPSPVVLSAFRLISGQRGGNLSDLMKWLPPPVSFAPRDRAQCRDLTEWWLWRLCEPDATTDPQALLDCHFPHLGRGLTARAARLSSEFTRYDGLVEQAGIDLDPSSATGPVMSTHRFETLGRCSLAYFFRYGLGIKPPDMIELVPGQWLSPQVYGQLLHEVLHEFAREKIEQNEPIEGASDRPRLEAILNECVEQYRDTYPPPTKNAFERQCEELRRAINIFLVEENYLRREQANRPAFAEAALGMPSTDEGAASEGTALDTSEPVQFTLNDGTSFRVCGRVDRIDRVGPDSAQTFAIWDYKSGTSWGYEQNDPFQQGRRVQHFVYLAMVAERLKATVSPQATVDRFGFFFPGTKVRGERVHWSRDELVAGQGILAQLCEVVRQGTFLPTTKKEDCSLCDFQSVCGDTEIGAKASQAKLDNDANTLLAPLRILRPPKSKGRGKRKSESGEPESDDAS